LTESLKNARERNPAENVRKQIDFDLGWSLVNTGDPDMIDEGVDLLIGD
jgi:hypothetical protein